VLCFISMLDLHWVAFAVSIHVIMGRIVFIIMVGEISKMFS
jgi:hypothetical protein